ncbi:MAG: hypothetical protein AAFO63_10425, partial [Pseudomonadota bacterium]
MDFRLYASELFSEAQGLVASRSRLDVQLSAIETDEIRMDVGFSEQTPVITFSYGFSMTAYRLIRLALASAPLFSEIQKVDTLNSSELDAYLIEIIDFIKEGTQGGPHYDVDDRIAKLSQRLVRDADIFFILHELAHIHIEQDKVGTMINMLTWGHGAAIPDLSNIREHELLADILASIWFFFPFLKRAEEHYEKLKSMYPDHVGEIDISEMRERDAGIRLVAIESVFLVQYVIEQVTKRESTHYVDFESRVLVNRNFLLQTFGLKRSVFEPADVILGNMMRA